MHDWSGDLFLTLARLVTAYGAAAAGGAALGVLLARYPRVAGVLGPLSLGLRVLPSVCLLPLATLWLGRSEGVLLVVTALSPVLVVAMTLEQAITSIPAGWLQTAATMGVQGWPLCLRVVLPAALPAWLRGLRNGWVLTWWSLLAAEMLFMDRGLGRLLAGAWQAGEVVLAGGLTALVLALGLVLDRLVFGACERFVRRRWGLEPT
jgi:NitT/TauT family transport system permease protein